MPFTPSATQAGEFGKKDRLNVGVTVEQRQPWLNGYLCPDGIAGP